MSFDMQKISQDYVTDTFDPCLSALQEMSMINWDYLGGDGIIQLDLEAQERVTLFKVYDEWNKEIR